MSVRPVKRSLFFVFSTLGCSKATWKEVVGLAKACGFPGVELRALKGSVDLPPLLEEEFATPEGMAAAVRESGLQVVSLDASFFLLEAEKEHWKEALALAPWADALRIPYLRVFDGGACGSGRDPEVRAGLRRALGVWSFLREMHGFQCELMVETHGALADVPSCVLLGLEMEAEDRTLHLLWDSCHTWNHSGPDLEKQWQLLKPWVRHIHVKDGAGLGKKFHHVLPGEGWIPVRPLLAALERDGFAGPVSLEWELMWHPELPPLAKALESGRHHAWWERSPEKE